MPYVIGVHSTVLEVTKQVSNQIKVI